MNAEKKGVARLRIEDGPSEHLLRVEPTASESLAHLRADLRRFVPPDLVVLDGRSTYVPVEYASVLAQGIPTADDALSERWREKGAAKTSRILAHLEAVRVAREMRPGIIREPSVSVPGAYALDQFQDLAVSQMTLPGLLGFCLFDEQGLGKTATALHAFWKLKRAAEVEAAVIVCPKTVMGEWKRQIATHLRVEPRVEEYSGSRAQRATILGRQMDLLICSYDMVRSDTAAISNWIRRTGLSALLIADESYFVKNPETQRARGLASLRPLFRRAFVLCGTPAPNAPWEIVEQMNLADTGIAFGDRLGGRKDLSLAEVDEILTTRGAFIRRLKSEVLPDLPGRESFRWIVEMPKVQAALYQRAAEALVLELRDLDDAAFRRSLRLYIQKRTALLEICSEPTMVDPTYFGVPAKYLAIDNLLARLARDEGKKVIVWSRWVKTIQALSTRYSETYGAVKIDGSVSSATREEAVTTFSNADGCRVLIANPAVAGQGLNLMAASDAIYESLPVETAHFLQSLDRIHRRGQEKMVRYHFLACGRTIEAQLLDQLDLKRKRSSQLLHDRSEEFPSRSALISEIERGLQDADG